uniref:FH2 domain-containing protein n=1 Tax=Macrostomum lignano TaxID=282301 RepID=A0A1I8JPH1_9PLAT
MRRERIRDADGNVIGYGKKEEYTGKRPVLGHGADGKKSRKKRDETGVEYEVYSDTSEGGTKRTMRRKVIRDELGNVIGHGEEEVYDSVTSPYRRQRRQNPQAEHGQSGQTGSGSAAPSRRQQKPPPQVATRKSAKAKPSDWRTASKSTSAATRRCSATPSTDSRWSREQLANMTEEERQEFLRIGRPGSSKREPQEGEVRGAEYSKMTEKNARKKEERKRRLEELQEEATERSGRRWRRSPRPKRKVRQRKSASKEYAGSARKRSPRKLKDGNEGDSESDYEPGPKRPEAGQESGPGSTGSSEQRHSGAEIIREKDGKILKEGKKRTRHAMWWSWSTTNKGNVVKRTVRQADEDQVTGIKRLRVIMKKGGSKLISHMHELIEKSHLADNATEEEKATEIDFLSAYRLVDPNKLETYGKAFVVEDFDDMDGLINPTTQQNRSAPSEQSAWCLQWRACPRGKIDYALQVLGFDGNTQLTFRMFSVAMALCERVTKMDQFCRDLLEITNLIDIERKLALYRAMFYCNIPSDRDPNYIKLDSLRIELMAGGLNWRQQEFIIDKLQPNEMFEANILPGLPLLHPAVPIFPRQHSEQPVGHVRFKVHPDLSKTRLPQRDMNPLAFPLKKNTKFMRDHAVGTLMEGKPLDSVVRKDNEKVQKAFDRKEGSISYPASAKGQSKDKD